MGKKDKEKNKEVQKPQPPPNWKNPFGTPLDQQEFVKIDLIVNGEQAQIPILVDMVIKHLRDIKGLHCEGIFRISGNASKVRAFKEAISKGEKLSFAKEDDPFDVSSLVKLYFRELPAPLLTYELYDCFIAVQGLPEELREGAIIKLLHLLPKNNLMLLICICDLLKEVSTYSQINKMTPDNLAICFAPNLLRPPNESIGTVLGDAGFANGLIRSLILHSQVLFQSFKGQKDEIKGQSEDAVALEQDLKKNYAIMRSETLHKMKSELQKAEDVDEAEKKLAEQYAKAVTGVSEEEIQSDTIVAEEYRQVLYSTLRKGGRWEVEESTSPTNDRKSPEISNSSFISSQSSFISEPSPSTTPNTTPKVNRPAPRKPLRAIKKSAIKKVKEASPDDLMKIYFS